MMLIGYRVNVNSKTVAEEAAKKRDPALCASIMNYGLLGPSTGESRSHCIYTYAKIAKDPTVCELLLPSSYGMSSIGGATNFPQQECIQVNSKKVNCYSEEEDILNVYDAEQIENCAEYKKYHNHQIIHWCFGERANKYGELDACLQDAVKDLEKDDCYYQRAMKVDDLQLSMCDQIESNELMRKDCMATVKAWIRYPQLLPK